MLQHNSSDFLAGIDRSAAAKTYRDGQRAELSNLAHVPLALWRYQVLGTITDPAATRVASTRYGATALLLHVTLDYELRGIDTVPSSHDQFLSFVERAGHTYLAGDDPLAGEGSVSWQGPWHYGPLSAARGSASLVLGPPADSSLLPALAAVVDDAVVAVTKVWGSNWSRRVAVVIPETTAEFRALTGSAIVDISAAAVTDGIDPTSGRPYGQRLVLNPAQLGKLSAIGRGIVLRHEITHLAAAADTADITPRWLVEGLADYVGNLTSGQTVRVAASELRTAIGAGRLPTALPTGADFATSGAQLAGIYEQSWLACRLIAGQVGQGGLLRFYRAVGTALEPALPALSDAFRTVLHETQTAFVRAWRTYLQTQLS